MTQSDKQELIKEIEKMKHGKKPIAFGYWDGFNTALDKVIELIKISPHKGE